MTSSFLAKSMCPSGKGPAAAVAELEGGVASVAAAAASSRLGGAALLSAAALPLLPAKELSWALPEAPPPRTPRRGSALLSAHARPLHAWQRTCELTLVRPECAYRPPLAAFLPGPLCQSSPCPGQLRCHAQRRQGGRGEGLLLACPGAFASGETCMPADAHVARVILPCVWDSKP